MIRFRDVPIKRKLMLGGLMLLLVFAVWTTLQKDVRTSEHDIKAVFIIRFAELINWPSSAFPSAHASFVIGVLGDDPFKGALDSASRNRTSHGRKLLIRNSRNVHDLQNCQIVFVARSESARLGGVIHSLKNPNVLTVGESERFCDLGGVINFALKARKVAYEINLSAAQRAGLELNPKLVRLGCIHPTADSGRNPP